MKFSNNLYGAGFWAHIVVQSVVCAASCKCWRDCLRHCCLLAKDFICSTMPSCPEAGQRAKLNRTCHSAQASLRSLLLEESCITSKETLNTNITKTGQIKNSRKFREFFICKFYFAVRPPSTGMILPVIKLLKGDSTEQITCAISSGSPTRSSG